MKKNNTPKAANVATEKSVYPDVYAVTPSAGDQAEEALQALAEPTLTYNITLGTKVLTVSNVPVKDNTTALQATIISTYGGLGEGEYAFTGTNIKVTVTDN